MESQTVTIQIALQTAALLQAKADAEGVSLDELLLLTFEAPNGVKEAEALLDESYIAQCATEADPAITLAEVREALSKISGSMSDEVTRERDER